jgi:LacI family transcriptional regulator
MYSTRMKKKSDLSKYIDVSAELEFDLQKGLWDGKKLPSVRKVAEKYSISIVTASRALQVLRDKGLISTVERSGCYRVAPIGAERWAIVLQLTKNPLIGLTTNLVQEGFTELSSYQPMHIHFNAFDLSMKLTLEETTKAAQLAMENGIQGVVMLPCRTGEADIENCLRFIEGCDSVGLPIVFIERLPVNETIEQRHDLVAIDNVSSGQKVLQHLYEQGKKNVGIVYGSNVTSHRERVAGYLLTHHEWEAKNKNQWHKPTIIHEQGNRSIIEVYSGIVDEVIWNKLDAIICYSDYVAQGVVQELLRRGKKVPEEIAVTGYDNLLIGELFPISLTTINYPATLLAEGAVRLLRERCKEQRENKLGSQKKIATRIVIPSELMARASTLGFVNPANYEKGE